MQVNQNGEPIKEDTVYSSCGQVFAFSTEITDSLRDSAIALLCEKLGVDIVSTNATKHGVRALVLREAA
jgi:hypothetical protein